MRYTSIVRSLAIFLLGLSFSALAQPGESIDHPLVIAYQGGAVTLDPIMRSENTAYTWQRHIFDTITILNRDGQVEPRIATSWENISPLKWRLTLRKNVKFHDGAPMTAEDVGKSLMDMANNPKSQLRTYVANVKSFKVINNHEIIVNFSQPDPIFPKHLIHVPVMPEKRIAKEGRDAFKNHPIGTGPYKFVSWENDNHLILRAWKGFWGKKPDFRHVKLVAIPNNATRVASLLTGRVQVSQNIAPSDFARIKNDDKAYIATAPGYRVMYLAMEYQNANNSVGVTSPDGKNPFTKVNVRKAVGLSIPKERLNKEIFQGAMTVANQFLPPIAVPYEDKQVPEAAPRKAKELLAEAGYPNGFKVRLDAPNDRYLYDSLVAQALSGFFSNIGISTSVDAVPKAVFFPKLDNGKSSFYFAGWGSTSDPFATWNSMFHCPDTEEGFGSVNRVGYCNKKADALMVQASKEFDKGKRMNLIHKAYNVAINKDYAYIPVYYQNVIAGVSSKINWESRPDEMILAWQMSRNNVPQ